MTSEEKKEVKRLYDIEYREKNKEKLDEQRKEWRKNNPEKIKEIRNSRKEKKKIEDRIYAQKNREKLNEKKRAWAKANKDKVKAAKIKYNKANKDKTAKYVRERLQNEPLYKLKARIRKSIWDSLKRQGYSKKSKSEDILGCTFEEFKEHIESQWEDWMKWDNYGKYNGEKIGRAHV